MSETKFHFSPRPNRAHEIRWREWGEDAFQEAKSGNKPVLLSLSAVWCHWCHVMDETSYSNEGVIAFINEHFVPVRVDNDQRPDVNARYNMGGWPTTAFLTPDGEVLAGGTYVPPDQMLELMPKVNVYYRSNEAEVTQKAADLRARRAEVMDEVTRGELSGEIFDQVTRSVAMNYDPVYGGFGDAPKFPHTDALDLLLYAHRRNGDPDMLHMARKTLEMMGAGGVFDQEWGGFFRYATHRDWSEPHYEKMLEDNANLLRNVLALYRGSGAQGHADIARRTIDYLEWKLRDPDAGYFFGSQDADEEFYRLSKAERADHEEPYIDRTLYTSWNAMAISAYLEASWTLDRPDLRDAALKALDLLWNEMRAPEGGLYRFRAPGGEPGVQGLLGDQVYTARALLDAAEVTGDPVYLERALEVAGFMLERFAHREADGKVAGFYDVWDQAPEQGRLRDRQKSMQDNAVCGEVFIRLHHLTRDESYAAAAGGTLGAFAGAYAPMGHFAAGYARAVDTFLNAPAVVNIVGGRDAVQPLHEAALALDAPSRMVQVLDPALDGERLAALYLPADPAPAAYVCVGTMCSATVTSPVALEQTVREMRTMAEPRTA
ncbi:MAG TPA: DUF255 domain-containing protein [Dehalococcoidia bacterium]|nr:DUF255 domain-containing protein [Dehalococcoidia bacterium]